MKTKKNNSKTQSNNSNTHSSEQMTNQIQHDQIILKADSTTLNFPITENITANLLEKKKTLTSTELDIINESLDYENNYSDNFIMIKRYVI